MKRVRIMRIADRASEFMRMREGPSQRSLSGDQIRIRICVQNVLFVQSFLITDIAMNAKRRAQGNGLKALVELGIIIQEKVKEK